MFVERMVSRMDAGKTNSPDLRNGSIRCSSYSVTDSIVICSHGFHDIVIGNPFDTAGLSPRMISCEDIVIEPKRTFSLDDDDDEVVVVAALYSCFKLNACVLHFKMDLYVDDVDDVSTITPSKGHSEISVEDV